MSYQSFADFYDELMSDADYDGRCEYLLSLFERHGHSAGLTLDLACGTGSLTQRLALSGVDVYGADGSAEMLSRALIKSSQAGLDILYLRQKMQELDLYGTVNTCVCTLDGINHLTDPEDVRRAFERVALFTEPDGLFVFDVNTVYKHQKILADNTFVCETDRVFCVWQNSLRADGRTVDIDLDFFERSGNAYFRTRESFGERAYTDGELREMLTSAGFEVEAVYGDLGFNDPAPDEQRTVYVARMILPRAHKP